MNRPKKQLAIIILALLSVVCFSSMTNTKDSIECSDKECHGQYEGAEFINGSDIAHQFSNKMSAVVGDKLKELFSKEKYSKVDFDNIIMTTKGMGTGKVNHYLMIPFTRVSSKCEAYTSFDHVGGWNHKPALEARKKQLEGALIPGQKLNISDLKSTPEGLQEHWIQWKNKVIQSMCE